ncbi:MAG: hypothetical protein U0807_00515 [Candidatus Binatia bacterium]
MREPREPALVARRSVRRHHQVGRRGRASRVADDHDRPATRELADARRLERLRHVDDERPRALYDLGEPPQRSLASVEHECRAEARRGDRTQQVHVRLDREAAAQAERAQRRREREPTPDRFGTASSPQQDRHAAHPAAACGATVPAIRT